MSIHRPPYSSVVIANMFLMMPKNPNIHPSDQAINHQKLQKLVYLAYGFHLVFAGERYNLVEDKPETGKHGPILPDVYKAFHYYGNRTLSHPDVINPYDDLDMQSIMDIDDKTSALVAWVWRRYGDLTIENLFEMTSGPLSAWRNMAVRYNYKVPKGTVIEDKEIYQSFLNIVEKDPYGDKSLDLVKANNHDDDYYEG